MLVWVLCLFSSAYLFFSFFFFLKINNRPAVSASARQPRVHDESEDNLFEQQNEALLNQLGGKVSSLKSLSITIGDSIKSSNKDLDDLSSDFGKTGALFGGVMNRFGKMVESGGAKNICYLVLFSLFVFFVIWFFLKLGKRH